MKQLKVHRGGYWGIVKDRAGGSLLAEHTIGFLLAGWSVAMGRMLIGMGLMKLGVFSAKRSRRFYLWMVAIGYGIGLPLMAFDAQRADPAQVLEHATRCTAACSTTTSAAWSWLWATSGW